jgi:hypothetical protein
MGQEAIAVGRMRVSAETLRYFCEWADIVVLMQECMIESVPDGYREKVRVVDVGVDRFGIWIHPELLEMVKAGANWLLGIEVVGEEK